ncbi:MAG: fused MFS/spermidine synthase [Haloarculaceae archaeon]
MRIRPSTTVQATAVGTAVFASGVSSMGLEILAGRLLAPTFGSSVFTWGSVIGVFLAALAAGYWLAGRRAAEGASRGALSSLLLLAAAYVAFVMVAAQPLVGWLATFPLPDRFAPLVPVTLLFGPPTVLLGFISPYGAELVDSDGPGDASGHVYALGTAGSLVGAFGATFLLLPELGIAGTELVFGLVLVAAAALLTARPEADERAGGRSDRYGRALSRALPVAVLLVVAFALVGTAPVGGAVVYQTQTEYQQLQVTQQGDVRTLYLDGAPHSAMDVTAPDRYVFEYTRYFHLPHLIRDEPDVDRVLFVGGGGFSGPKRYLAEYPDATVDVVELDPAVVDAAREYFRVPDSPRLTVHTMDGRRFLRETNRTYDVIVLDAYRADEVPYHLTTVEFMRLVEDRLAADGAVVANLISATDGSASTFYRAEFRTMDRVFGQVYSFPTSDTGSLQNIELVATKTDRRVTQATLRERNRARDVGLDLSAAIDNYRADVPVRDAPLLRDGDGTAADLVAGQVDRQYVVERTNGSAVTSGTDATSPSLAAP